MSFLTTVLSWRSTWSTSFLRLGTVVVKNIVLTADGSRTWAATRRARNTCRVCHRAQCSTDPSVRVLLCIRWQHAAEHIGTGGMLQERGRQHCRRHLFEDRNKIAQIDRGEVLEPCHFLQNDLQRGTLRASSSACSTADHCTGCVVFRHADRPLHPRGRLAISSDARMVAFGDRGRTSITSQQALGKLHAAGRGGARKLVP